MLVNIFLLFLTAILVVSGFDCLSSNPCQNGATCNGNGCLCTLGWKGRYCETKDLCSPNPCHNGDCKMSEDSNSFTCDCFPGHSGLYCEDATCDSDPCNGGTCTLQGPQGDHVECYPCREGFSGRFCDTCAPGYTTSEESCDTPSCDSNTCNGGTCEVITDTSGKNIISCTDCPSGLAGTYCEESCTPNPCHGGECLIEDGNLKCECKEGDYGRLCQFSCNICLPSPCLNGGTCEDLGNNFLCHCTPIWSGLTCDSSRDPCILDTPCAANEVCTVLTVSPWTSCSPTDPCACSGHGACTEDDDYDNHKKDKKSNYDIIIPQKCVCYPGYTGLYCETVDPDSDGDGVYDSKDICPDTPNGVKVNEDGCSLDQACPCDDPELDWKHKDYVDCVRDIAEVYLHFGYITKKQYTQLISNASKSGCYKKNNKP